MILTGLSLENYVTVLVFFVTFFLVCVLMNAGRLYGVPPGPYRFPVVGNLGSLLGKDTLALLGNLREKYGDIYGLYIGSQLNIFLNGFDAIHDALVKRGRLFSRRPILNQREKDWIAIVFGNDETWKELRTFTLNTFRDLCFRKSGHSLEVRITDELTCLVDKLGSLNNEDIDVSDLVTQSFANVVFSVIHGRRIGYENTKFQWLLRTMDEGFRAHVRYETLNACFPFLHYVPGDLLKEKHAMKTIRELEKYYEEMCTLNFDNYQQGDDKCFVDYWIAAWESKPLLFTKEKLWITLHDLMAAGSETTATTLKWIILALVKYPDIQEKLRRQVDKVIERNVKPSMADKVNLPYVEATVLEGLRIGSVVPLAIPHAVTNDTLFHGYKICTKSSILPNIASVHFDADIFPEPETFKPERFLNEDETSIVGTEKLIPFSLGPRSCVGETLARMELFLYLTTLVQTFEFRPPEASILPPLKGVVGLTHRPERFKINVCPRT